MKWLDAACFTAHAAVLHDSFIQFRLELNIVHNGAKQERIPRIASQHHAADCDGCSKGCEPRAMEIHFRIISVAGKCARHWKESRMNPPKRPQVLEAFIAFAFASKLKAARRRRSRSQKSKRNLVKPRRPVFFRKRSSNTSRRTSGTPSLIEDLLRCLAVGAAWSHTRLHRSRSFKQTDAQGREKPEMWEEGIYREIT